MKNILRKIVVASVAVAAIALASNSAMAASKVNVPFEFKVGSKTCPAGEYTVQPGLNRNVVVLASIDGSHSFTWLLQPGDASPLDKSVVLKFDEQANGSYLRSVQYGAMVTPRLDKGTNRLEHSNVEPTSVRLVTGR
jgi:hypothetical protein